MEEYIRCFSCQALALNIEGETHAYMLSAPGCWAMFCEVLEKEYTDYRYTRAHQYTVDSYACQHPGSTEVQSAVNSVGIHLSSLYMVLERGMRLSKANQFKQRFAQYNKQQALIQPLSPPDSLGEITVCDIWSLEEEEKHFDLCEQWAVSAWRAWRVHHRTIEAWVTEFFQDNPTHANYFNHDDH